MEIKLDKFKPRSYQMNLINAFEKQGYRRLLVCWPRRAGKDITIFNLLIRASLKKVGVYFYVFPEYAQAKRVIWDSITNTGERFLDYIPKGIIKSSNSQEMKIVLHNGSLIQLAGSNNIDALRGTNPQGIVFSEYAWQDPEAYKALRPILLANDGWAIFASCVNPETLVLSENGLRRIKTLSSSRKEYTEFNKPIFGLGGFHNADQFYYGGVQKTLKITLRSGYSIECTPVHPIWNGTDWIRSRNLKIGDLIPVQYGQNIWDKGLDISDFVPNYHGANKPLIFDVNSLDSFYLLGLFHADGNYNNQTLCITKKKDPEIIEFLRSLGFRTRNDGIHHEYSSKVFVALLEYLGFKHGARNKIFPEKLFECNKEQMSAFLQGLFDGDGSSCNDPKKRGRLSIASTSLDFIKTLQVILLNFGVASSLLSNITKPSNRVKVSSLVHSLEINGYFAHIFYRDIGFRLVRKQKNWAHIPESVRRETSNIYPIDSSKFADIKINKNKIVNPSRMSRNLLARLHEKYNHPYFEELLREKFFYSPIISIEESESEVFDFVIPETHSFFSNGFISHNTPFGNNAFYDLYRHAAQSPDWFCEKLTVEDTKHISLEAIQKEREEGLISEDMIEQEYYTSFNRGVEGAYYAKYVERMRLDGRIGDVPVSYGTQVHTAWDLGVRDSTSIVFFETVAGSIRIVDYYENSKHGLEHYVQVIKSKPYLYGKHIAPHDIAVREFTSGIARIDKARELGINFTIAPNLSIEDGIEAVRTMLNKTYIDQRKCERVIKALENYRQEWDSKNKVYKSRPLHDMWSHTCDSLRYMAVSLPKTRDSMSPEELDKRYKDAMGMKDDPFYGFKRM